MPKLNKLNIRSGLYKVVGELGLRENLYYGSIFLCMTLIVIVCFLVINNRGGSDHLSGTAAAIFDVGKPIKYLRLTDRVNIHKKRTELGRVNINNIIVRKYCPCILQERDVNILEVKN